MKHLQEVFILKKWLLLGRKFFCFVYVQYDRYKNVTAVIHIGETIIQQFCTFLPNFHALFYL